MILLYRSIVIENIVPTVDYKNRNLICREWLNFEYPKHFKLIMTEIKPVHEGTYFIYFKFKFPVAFQLTGTAVRGKCVHIQFRKIFLGNVYHPIYML